jgi:hypothetical protein
VLGKAESPYLLLYGNRNESCALFSLDGVGGHRPLRSPPCANDEFLFVRLSVRWREDDLVAALRLWQVLNLGIFALSTGHPFSREFFILELVLVVEGFSYRVPPPRLLQNSIRSSSLQWKGIATRMTTKESLPLIGCLLVYHDRGAFRRRREEDSVAPLHESRITLIDHGGWVYLRPA